MLPSFCCWFIEHSSSSCHLSLSFSSFGPFPCEAKDLTPPLSCLIDYRGRRLFCLALLPINKDTLVLGSCDGGKTVLHEDPVLFSAMEHVGSHAHLATHLVMGVPVVGGGDVEVHRGLDGRGYILDLARLFPPVMRCKGEPGSSVFVNLFRPELLLSLKRNAVCPPLSSDTGLIGPFAEPAHP